LASEKDSSKPVRLEWNTTPLSNKTLDQSLSNISGTTSNSIERYIINVSKKDIDELHELMLKALITSGCTFAILSNYYFEKYQNKIFGFLGITNFPLPNYYYCVQKLLPDLVISEAGLLADLRGATIAIDGATDGSGKNFYGLMIMQIGKPPILLNFLSFETDSKDVLTKKRMTASNLCQATCNLLKNSSIDTCNIAAVVTDNPTVMRSYRKLMCNKFKHLVPIYCSLHVFNKLIEWFMSFPLYRHHFKDILALVNAFKKPGYYKDTIDSWREKLNFNSSNDDVYALSALCESRYVLKRLH